MHGWADMAKSAPKSEDSAKKAVGRPQIPEKCRKCAMLTMPQVHALHGNEGDRCYEPKVCRSRRSHARKAEQNNYKRRIQHQQKKLQNRAQEQPTISAESHPPLSVELPISVVQRYYAILVLYREPKYRGRVHAIRAQVWQGSQLVNEIQGEHCLGMTPTEVIQYVEAMLALLKQTYNVSYFADIEQLDPDYCPLQPCPRHSTSRLSFLP